MESISRGRTARVLLGGRSADGDVPEVDVEVGKDISELDKLAEGLEGKGRFLKRDSVRKEECVLIGLVTAASRRSDENDVLVGLPRVLGNAGYLARRRRP